MNIQEAKQEIIHTIQAYTAKNDYGIYKIPALRQRPLLLIGPPGIGKTAIMEQAANECRMGFVSYTMTHHTRQSATGLPHIEQRSFLGQEYSITEYTMSEIIASVYQCMEEKGCREGLLFLDEINCVSETLAPAMLQFLQNKTFGSHRLPEGWILVTAGNPQEYNKSAHEFDIATLDRLKYITIEPDYQAWRCYALSHHIHGAILSYLDINPSSFYILEQTYQSKKFTTARGWEDLSYILYQYEELEIPITTALIQQYLHSESIANDFSGYYRLYMTNQKNVPVIELCTGDQTAYAVCRKIMMEGTSSLRLHMTHLLLNTLGLQLSNWKNDLSLYREFSLLMDSYKKYFSIHKLSASQSEETFLSFWKEQKNILHIRRQYTLSNDHELDSLKQQLYMFQNYHYQFYAEHPLLTAAQEYPLYLTVLEKMDTAIRQKEKELLHAMEQLLQFYEETMVSEFSIFLSGIEQNELARNFFHNNPCPSLSHHLQRIQFKSREENLKNKIISGSAV